jgi:ATP-dependent helicase Lhr and Lhr-like helicase
VCGCDPLNLVGIILPGARVPAVASSRILLRDGIAIATLVAGEVCFAEEVSADERATLEPTLRRTSRKSPGLAAVAVLG